MRKCRKLLSIIVICSLIFTMNLGFVSAAVAGDTTAPVVNSMRIMNPEIGDGAEDTLKLEFDWIEEGVGILTVRSAVRNIETNQSYSLTGTTCVICSEKDDLSPCFTGIHQMQFKLDDLPGGTYEFYEMYVRENTNRKIWLVNTNKLVRFYDGVDGLKTGYTKEAGYCLTATAKRNDMRLIAVVMGENDSQTRNSEVTSMLDYAFSQYEVEKLLSKDSVVGETILEKGIKKYVELVPVNDVTVLNKKIDGKKNATYEVEVNKISAPIKKGDIVGKLHIKENENITRTIDLTVKEDIKKANIFDLYLRYLKEILTGDIKVI